TTKHHKNEIRQENAAANGSQMAAPEPASASMSANNALSAPFSKANRSKSGSSYAAQAKIPAANAPPKVAAGPPSVSTRFLASPGHSVPQPVYIRVASISSPPIKRTACPDCFRRRANSKSSQIALQ